MIGKPEPLVRDAEFGAPPHFNAPLTDHRRLPGNHFRSDPLSQAPSAVVGRWPARRCTRRLRRIGTSAKRIRSSCRVSPVDKHVETPRVPAPKVEPQAPALQLRVTVASEVPRGSGFPEPHKASGSDHGARCRPMMCSVLLPVGCAALRNRERPHARQTYRVLDHFASSSVAFLNPRNQLSRSLVSIA